MDSGRLLHRLSARNVRTGVVVAAVAVATGTIGIARASTPANVATMFVPLPPVRILDTRDGTGANGSTVPLAGGQSIVLQVTGAGDVPADAVAVQLNMTATQGTAPGFVTVWPTGSARPNSSVLNVVPGQDVPNMIAATLGTNGQLSLFTNTGTVHVIADVAGYYVRAETVTGAVHEVPAEARWTVMWPLSPSGVGTMAVREGGSIRTQSNPADTLTRIGTGQYCIKANNATEGAVGSIQVGGAFATIRVSMGVGSFCNAVSGANITVEILQLG